MNGLCRKVVSEVNVFFSLEEKPLLLLLILLSISHHNVVTSNFCSHFTSTVLEGGGKESQSCLSTVSVAVSLPCPCPDCALPPLSLEIPSHQHEQPLLSTIACLEENQTSSPVFCGLLPPKQDRASVGRQQEHWHSSQQVPLLPLGKHLRSPRW